MLIRYHPHSKGQWKNSVLASDSSNQQDLVLKKRFQLNLCKCYILNLPSGTFILLRSKYKNIHTWSFYILNLVPENYLSFHSCHFFNQTPSCICSICLYCVGKVSNCWTKAVVGVDRPIKALSKLIQKPYKEKIVLNSHSCNFVKIIQPNSFMHMFNESSLFRQSIKLIQQKLW